MVTKHCYIIAMYHTTCKIKERKITEIEDGNTQQTICHGCPGASGQGHWQLPLQAYPAGHNWTSKVQFQLTSGQILSCPRGSFEFDCRPRHDTLRTGTEVLSHGSSVVTASGSGAYNLQVQIHHTLFKHRYLTVEQLLNYLAKWTRG